MKDLDEAFDLIEREADLDPPEFGCLSFGSQEAFSVLGEQEIDGVESRLRTLCCAKNRWVRFRSLWLLDRKLGAPVTGHRLSEEIPIAGRGFNSSSLGDCAASVWYFESLYHRWGYDPSAPRYERLVQGAADSCARMLHLVGSSRESDRHAQLGRLIEQKPDSPSRSVEADEVMEGIASWWSDFDSRPLASTIAELISDIRCSGS